MPPSARLCVDVDAIEALGQPRQMLGRDAGSVVAHRRPAPPAAVGRGRGREADIDALAGRAVLQRVLDQVLEHAGELVAVARHDQRRVPAARSRSRRCGRSRASAGRRPPAARPATRSTGVSGCMCSISSMRESESRSSISRAMRAACVFMMARKRLARRRVLARGAQQRVDEARERGERRAQLVARIGDEVGAHLLDAAQRREIVERQQHRGRRQPAERRDMRREPAVDRHALGELHAARLASPAATSRTASTTSGTRSASEAGAPRASAGAITRAAALKVTTRPSRSSTIAASGMPATTASSTACRRRARVGARPAASAPRRHVDRTASRTSPWSGASSYLAGATPSHNSRTPRITSESANGTI